MDDPSAGSDTLRQDQSGAESSRRLSGKDEARQDPAAPAIEGYVLTARLGAGAYGEVWRAWQQRTGKWVAVKVFPRRHGVDWLLLQREVERLIKLDKHPHVVSLLDADLTGDPPYFVMELMEGGSLARFVDPARTAAPEQAARWAEQLAEALCYVHSKGILHCDLKPANVLLDDEGRVRVADFGQSRIASESTGALGTLYFMAPEQALTFKQNEQLCPDVRWDVFGLGATLFAVLTGRPPHESELKDKLSVAESLDARLELYRNGIRSAPVPEVSVDEDLAAIVRRCLEPWPEKRYETAGSVAADLSARREGRPVSPLAASTAYRARKFVRRNAPAVALGTLLAAAVGIGTSTVFRQNAALETELANAYALRARAAADKGDDATAAVLFARANALHPSVFARRGALAHLQALERPRQVFDLKAPVDALAVSADGTRVIAGGVSLDAVMLDARTGKTLTAPKPTEALARAILIGGSEVLSAEFNREGTRALASSHQAIGLLDAVTGAPVAELSGYVAHFSPDGKRIAIAGGTKAGEVRLLDAATGNPTGVVFRHPLPKDSWELPSFSFSPDGKTFLTCAKDKLQLYDASTGKPLGEPLRYDAEVSLAIGPLEEARFSPDGNSILSVSWSRAAVLDRRTGKPIGQVMRHDGRLRAGMFTPDGKTILTVGEDGTLRQWYASARKNGVPGGAPIQAGAPVETTLRHGAEIISLAVSRDGRFAATAGADGVARLWSLSPWGAYGREMLHGSPVLTVAFSGDGKTLATGGRDGTVRIWDVPAGPVGRSYSQLLLSQISLSPGGARLVGFDYSKGPALLELPSGKAIDGAFPGASGPSKDFHTMAFSADGSRLVTFLREANEAYVWDAATGKPIGSSFSHAAAAGDPKPMFTPSLSAATLDRHGTRLLTYSLEKGVRLWDVAAGKLLAETKPVEFIHALAFSPEGDRVALPASESTEIRDQALARVLMTLKHGGGAVAWSPDGRRLATVNDEHHTVRLWDAATGASLGPGLAHEDRVTSVLFSADGAVLATTSEDGTARLLDARTGGPIGTPLAHGAKIWTAALSPDGTVLATGGMDGMIRFWDTKAAEPAARALNHGRLVDGLAFSPDGKTLYATGNFSLQGWDVSWLAGAPPPERLFTAAQSLTQRTVDGSGRVVPIAIKAWDRSVTLP